MQDEFVENDIPARVPAGFVLVDATLQVIYCNTVALEIFGYPEMGKAKEKLNSFILGTLGPVVGNGATGELSFVSEFVSGRRQYFCRAYSLSQSQSGLPGQHIAIVLERNSSILSGLTQVSRQFGLSPREAQVLRLAVRGCCNKEMAEELNLSPNTVKAFIRMVMIKMSVTTRARVVCKTLNYLEELHERELSNDLSQELDFVQATARLAPASALSARMAPRGKANGNGSHSAADSVVRKPEVEPSKHVEHVDHIGHIDAAVQKARCSDTELCSPHAFESPVELVELDDDWRTRFTPKETKILALVAQGSTCEEIAARLRAPEKTVRNYLRALLSTTGLSELSELAEFTLAHRLLDPPAKEY